MIDPVTARTWSHRVAFVALIGFLSALRLMPLGVGSIGLPGPDMLLAVTFAWVLRRPAFVPAWLIVALFLPLDLIFQRPPGLGALVTLVAAEFLRSRAASSGSLPFPIEWGMVAAVLVAMVAASQLLLALFFVPRPPLGLDLLRALFTAGVYPIAVLLSAYIFGVRKASPGEVDALGARL